MMKYLKGKQVEMTPEEVDVLHSEFEVDPASRDKPITVNDLYKMVNDLSIEVKKLRDGRS